MRDLFVKVKRVVVRVVDQELLLLSFLFTCSLVVVYVMIKMEEYYEHPEHNIDVVGGRVEDQPLPPLFKTYMTNLRKQQQEEAEGRDVSR